ncbi:bifunctional tetrahydrofolate synthase/dihydrofolate synthase [Candidatus Erwinia haradaeae]|uniref:Dihydrofolate synthase/folylpolyglutamate synthase n=1 Tax=Candidatus Erwinia haradaeae TaxID=1922217 RepID=A0A803FTN9_9GAMM|nr:bifunctional tetrahydrofolate synthase/dihydrofolate synthase [Candidatus Erwinia haradaeae]VFP88157.1 Dihydrofolate synthase/folylpolyglutamate synthase [Candidatus Erwinia haradaeae]
MNNLPQNTSSIASWLHYLKHLHSQSIDLGLTRVRHVGAALNLLSPSSFVFTVAGTNGKGTTCRALETMLLAGGYKVGVYNSPHLVHYTERVRIQGKELTDIEHTSAFSEVESARSNIPLTYFEFGTLSALWLFKQACLDVLILEVGLGGRLDATNIIDTDVAVVTNIALDHTMLLGTDREKIGYEKAGIFRKGKLAVIGEPYLPQSVKDTAIEKGAILHQYDSTWSYRTTTNSWVFYDLNGSIEHLSLPEIPIRNAATALAALRSSPFHIDKNNIQHSLNQATLPGRFQIVSEAPRVILDVAHNPHAAQYLSQRLIKIQQNSEIHAVVGMRNDKDIAGTLSYLIHNVDYWYCASLEEPYGSTAKKLASYLDQAKPFPSVELAWLDALKNAKQKDIILVFGSFHTVGQVIKKINQYKI